MVKLGWNALFFFISHHFLIRLSRPSLLALQQQLQLPQQPQLPRQPPTAATAPTAPNSYNCPGSPQLPPTATIAPNCPASSSCGSSSGGSGLNLKASSGCSDVTSDISSWFWIFGPVWTPPTSGGSGGSGVRNLLTTLGWNVFSGDRVCVCSCRQLKKLSEDSLTKQPEEVFDILEKLGEG